MRSSKSVGKRDMMHDIVYDNIVEAVRSQNPNHVILNCLDHEGFAVRYQNYQMLLMENGSVGIVSAGLNMQFYRGESKVHDTCFASLYRIKDFDEQVVALLKSYEFQQFLETTAEVQEWKRKNLRLDLWAICQHYEFVTPMIDITSEIAVAAFFATHKYDWRINQYVLQRDGIGQIICYSGIPELEAILRSENTARNRPHGIKLIGLQPFNRPGNQDGAGLWLDKDEDMIQQGTVIKFKQDEEVNFKLEKAMLIGADIFFPHEPVTEAALMIKKSKVITRGAIDRFMTNAGTWIGCVPDRKHIEQILKDKQIHIVDAPVIVGSMLGNVKPPIYDGARSIIRRPALDRYLSE